MPTIECSTACTVSVALTFPAPSTEEIADLGVAFMLIVGATVVIWGMRQLLKLVTADNES
jgi:hypothetical protein